ncbi:MAG: cytochrome c maturation protein CcmE [Acidobacteria bacterium]|nr:cytochrome c maturation protein CcmE [Acidobacteriota bacterium]MCH8986175.1 cytochrome c maturation protein CcmE [Acidobacteriota bacterium]
MKRYVRFLIPAVAILGVLVAVLFTLSDSLVYFYTPTDIVSGDITQQRFRIGGEVLEGSVTTTELGVEFTVTDGRESIGVVHSGAPQQLFQEGIGVVLEGSWDGAVFRSDTMLVKHDETYVADDGEVFDYSTDEGER